MEVEGSTRDNMVFSCPVVIISFIILIIEVFFYTLYFFRSENKASDICSMVELMR
jgi:hypothetical protein